MEAANNNSNNNAGDMEVESVDDEEEERPLPNLAVEGKHLVIAAVCRGIAAGVIAREEAAASSPPAATSAAQAVEDTNENNEESDVPDEGVYTRCREMPRSSSATLQSPLSKRMATCSNLGDLLRSDRCDTNNEAAQSSEDRKKAADQESSHLDSQMKDCVSTDNVDMQSARSECSDELMVSVE